MLVTARICMLVTVGSRMLFFFGNWIDVWGL